MFFFIEMINVLTNIYVPHGMSTITRIINVIKKLMYNYVPHGMSNVTKVIKVTEH
jgi:hypothetical protein